MNKTLSLAKIKRRLQIGAEVRLIQSLKGPCDLPRTVTKAQTNAVVFLDENGKRNWLHWPKAKHVQGNEKGFSVYVEHWDTHLVYEWVRDAPPSPPKPAKEEKKPKDDFLKGDNVHEIAAKKARYGHKDWIVWRGRDGEKYAARATEISVKAALLAIGTQGKFLLYPGECVGCGFAYDWGTGINVLNQMKRGWYGVTL
jgi:hypothetical protein